MKGHILLVEDEAPLRHTLARILQGAGFQVTTAATGTESLGLLQQHTFDLVYLDIRLPDMSGMDILKRLHAQNPSLPVVLFTAQPDLQTALEALRQGAVDYLLKPLHPAEFLQRTESILARHALEQRKRFLREQIARLQAELDRLEREGTAALEAQPAVPLPQDRYIRQGRVSLDLYTHCLLWDDCEVNLPQTAFNYLAVLVRHAPGVVDYLTLVTEAQGYQVELREAQELAKWHIHQIRQALQQASTDCPLHIVNVRGIGYRLVVD